MTRSTKGRNGFSLVELLVVVAVIGIVSSIALPIVARSMVKSRVTAAGAALRALHVGMLDWAKEGNCYPTQKELNLRTLDPLVRDGVMRREEARGILKSFVGNQIKFYSSACPSYIIYSPVRGTTYQVRLSTGVLEKRNTATFAPWTAIDDWTRGK